MKKTPRGRAALCAVGMVLCLAAIVGVMYVLVDPIRTGRMFSGAYWDVADWLAATAYPLLIDFLLCVAFAACLRVVAEALYCLVNDRRGVPYGLCMLVVAVAASAGVAASVSAVLSLGIGWGLAPLAIAIVLSIVILHCVSRHADVMSLSADATRHGMIPYQPYELASRRSFPLGILPTYRGMRRSIRRMQSVGTRSETFLAIGSEAEAADVISMLPAGSPLGTFIAKVVDGMPGNDVRYPFGVGRMTDADGKRFAIATAKKLSHTLNIEVVPADEFCATMNEYAWLVRQTFVVRDASGSVPRKVSQIYSAFHEKGKVLPMSDGTSVILPPDKSGVIPIDQSTVVPIIKTDDTGDTGLIHADVSSLVDVDDGTKARGRHKSGTKPAKIALESGDGTNIDDATDTHGDAASDAKPDGEEKPADGK